MIFVSLFYKIIGCIWNSIKSNSISWFISIWSMFSNKSNDNTLTHKKFGKNCFMPWYNDICTGFFEYLMPNRPIYLIIPSELVEIRISMGNSKLTKITFLSVIIDNSKSFYTSFLFSRSYKIFNSFTEIWEESVVVVV